MGVPEGEDERDGVLGGREVHRHAALDLLVGHVGRRRAPRAAVVHLI